MNYPWILYLLALSGILSAAAWLVQVTVLSPRSASSRWPWLVASVAGLVLPVAALLDRGDAVAREPGVLRLAPLDFDLVAILPEVAPARLPAVDGWLMPAWVALSLIVAIRLVGHWRAGNEIVRSAQHLPSSPSDVLLSPAGPAVIGFVHPRIVLPPWTDTMDAADREVLIAHERSHITARDPLLLLVGHLATVVQPWNPFVWLQLHRLREAIELDCDRRILASESPSRYGRMLLEVAGRRAGWTPALGTSLVRTRSQLERRIMNMLPTQATRPLPLRLVGAIALTGLGIAACSVDAPPTASESAATQAMATVEAPAANAATVESPEVMPNLNNRPEFSTAMVNAYPATLKGQGIGGVVEVRAHITANGDVDELQVVNSSGYPDLDQAASDVMLNTAQFDPAQDAGRPVATWIQLPLRFQQ